MKIITVAGRKGGVGKTTLSLMLANYFASIDLKTVLVDLDPQGSASLATGREPTAEELCAFLSLEVESSSIASLMDYQGSLIVLSGGPELETLEVDGLPFPLRESLACIEPDVVIVDCPPGHAALDTYALQSSDVVLVGSESHRLAIAGAVRVLAEVNDLKLPVAVVLGRVDSRRGLDKAAPDLLAGALGCPIFSIRQDSSLSAALNAGEMPPTKGKAADDLAPIISFIESKTK